MKLIVEPGDPRGSQATALLAESQALMQSLFAPEDNHFLSLDALCAPNVHFYIARRGGDTLGTAALVERNGYGEVKSMFVTPAARGQRIAEALLRQLEDHARSLDLSCLRLETGAPLEAACRLYRRHGFVDCAAFGEYAASDASLFMEKDLVSATNHP